MDVARRLKQHCVVEVYVDQETDVYVLRLEQERTAIAGIGNVELRGSLDRLLELTEALRSLVQLHLSDPELQSRWRDDFRPGHPAAITLAKTGGGTHDE